MKYYKTHLNINEEYSDNIVIKTDQPLNKSRRGHILHVGDTAIHLGSISYLDGRIHEITPEEAQDLTGTFDPID